MQGKDQEIAKTHHTHRMHMFKLRKECTEVHCAWPRHASWWVSEHFRFWKIEELAHNACNAPIAEHSRPPPPSSATAFPTSGSMRAPMH